MILGLDFSASYFSFACFYFFFLTFFPLKSISSHYQVKIHKKLIVTSCISHPTAKRNDGWCDTLLKCRLIIDPHYNDRISCDFYFGLWLVNAFFQRNLNIHFEIVHWRFFSRSFLCLFNSKFIMRDTCCFVSYSECHSFHFVFIHASEIHRKWNISNCPICSYYLRFSPETKIQWSVQMAIVHMNAANIIDIVIPNKTRRWNKYSSYKILRSSRSKPPNVEVDIFTARFSTDRRSRSQQ